MKGSVHAAIGASAPIGLVVTQYVNVMQGFTMAAIAAGFSLLPDLDHPRACASKALGSPVHKVAHQLCKVVVNKTATGRDRSRIAWKNSLRQDPYHRTLTHTLLASLLVGLIVYAAAWMGVVAIGVMSAFGVLLLWPLYRKTIGLIIFAAVVAAAASAILLNPWLLAMSAFAGYLSHVVADGCTKGGVPALWPMEIRGARWRQLRLMGTLVASGSEQEKGPAVGVAAASNVVLLLLAM